MYKSCDGCGRSFILPEGQVLWECPRCWYRNVPEPLKDGIVEVPTSMDSQGNSIRGLIRVARAAYVARVYMETLPAAPAVTAEMVEDIMRIMENAEKCE